MPISVDRSRFDDDICCLAKFLILCGFGTFAAFARLRSEEHTSELQSRRDIVCRPTISTLFPYTTLFRSRWFVAMLEMMKKDKSLIAYVVLRGIGPSAANADFR